MIWTYKNDVQWWDQHGKIPPLVFQEMKPGWDSKVSKTGICKLGGLHPLTVLLMEKVHVILFSKHRPRSVYSVRNLDSSPHFSHGSVNEIIKQVATLNKANGTSIEVVIHTPDGSPQEAAVKVVTEGTEDWALLASAYEELGMERFSKVMMFANMQRDAGRGNLQKGYGRTCQGYCQSPNISKLSHPSIATGTDANKVRDMAVLAQLLSLMVAEKVFTNPERSSSVKEMANRAGISVSGVCYEALTHALTGCQTTVYCHVDHNNDKREGYQWTTTANYVFFDTTKGVYHRACKIGYTRNSVGCFYDRMSLADVALNDFKAFVATLHPNRTTFGPELLKTLPESGFAGVEAHLDKVVGFYSIYGSALNARLKEYEQHYDKPMSLHKRIELIYPSICSNKPMNYVKALNDITVPQLNSNVCLSVYLFRNYRKNGGHDAGGHFARFQCSFQKTLTDLQLSRSLKTILCTVTKIWKAKKANHRDVIDCLKKGVYGAHDFLSHHIVALLCLTGTVQDLDLLVHASISELTTTSRKLEERYGIATQSQRCALLSMTAKATNQTLQACENGYCKEFADNKSRYGDTVMAGQTFYWKPCGDNTLFEISESHPKATAAKLPSPPIRCLESDKEMQLAVFKWWLPCHQAELRQTPERITYSLSKAKTKSKGKKGKNSQGKKEVAPKRHTFSRCISLNGAVRTIFSPPPIQKRATRKRKKKRKRVADEDRNYVASNKRRLLVYHGLGRNTRYSVNSRQSGRHPSLLELQTDVDIANFKVLDFRLLFEKYYAPFPHKGMFVYTHHKRENGYSCSLKDYDSDMSCFPIPCGLRCVRKTLDGRLIPVYFKKAAAKYAMLLWFLIGKEAQVRDRFLPWLFGDQSHVFLRLSRHVNDITRNWGIMYRHLGSYYIIVPSAADPSATRLLVK